MNTYKFIAQRLGTEIGESVGRDETEATRCFAAVMSLDNNQSAHDNLEWINALIDKGKLSVVKQ